MEVLISKVILYIITSRVQNTLNNHIPFSQKKDQHVGSRKSQLTRSTNQAMEARDNTELAGSYNGELK
jgi:hypothetical protein